MSPPADILERFGNRVHKLRKQRGWSQEEFAHHCVLDRTYVGGIERGERNLASRNIERIAVLLDVTLSQLMKRRVGATARAGLPRRHGGGSADQGHSRQGKRGEGMKPSSFQMKHISAGVVFAALLVLIFACVVLTLEHLRQATMHEQQTAVVAEMRPRGDSPVPAGSATARLFYDDEVAKIDGVYEPLSRRLVDEERARASWLPQRPRRVVLVMFYSRSKYKEVEALGDLPWLEQIILFEDEEQLEKHNVRRRLNASVGPNVELIVRPW